MNVIGINGSPRTQWNTAILLGKALEGAASKGALTDQINLYELDYKGCRSCFACKIRGGKSYGKCAVSDDLTPVLKEIGEADAIILASPIYFGSISGEMKSFVERLNFPYLTYTDPVQTLFPRTINIGCIFTVNVPKGNKEESGYAEYFQQQGLVLQTIFGGNPEYLYSDDACQYEDCRKAFELGIKMAGKEKPHGV